MRRIHWRRGGAAALLGALVFYRVRGVYGVNPWWTGVLLIAIVFLLAVTR